MPGVGSHSPGSKMSEGTGELPMSENAIAPAGSIKVQCCIAGGGPAGMMLGFLLARAGVAVVVLEKHEDFLRDFRGDTVHPSMLDMMQQLGLLQEFLRVPHSAIREISLQIGDDHLVVGYFEHLPVHCKF